MNFENLEIVSETFLRQQWVLLLVDGAIYLTETYSKMHWISMGYTTLLQKFWNYTKINTWEDHEVRWERLLSCFAAKTTEAATGAVLQKKMFLKTFYKKRLQHTTVFLWNFQNCETSLKLFLSFCAVTVFANLFLFPPSFFVNFLFLN